MEPDRKGSWSGWRGAVKGGLVGGVIAVAAPFILGWIMSLVMDREAQEGIGMMELGALLAAPTIFVLGALLGAVGGTLINAGRARRAATPVDIKFLDVAPVEVQKARFLRVGWVLTGAVAGFAASTLTTFQWPMMGGVLIGIALIPVWMLIGAALGNRVAVSRSADRPILGGVIVAAAAFIAIAILLGFLGLGRHHPDIVAALISIPGGLFVIWRLHAERSRDEDPGAAR
jgi:hypothetical protein